MADYNPEIKKVIDSFLLNEQCVTPGKMFGFPAYYINRKLFACIYDEGVGLKVPADTVKEHIGKPGIIPFQPYGKAVMKEWIQINRGSPEQYLADLALFQQSIDFVLSLSLK
jgi:hypothetical protein